MSADSKLTDLNLELPPAPKPAGVYKPLVISGDMVYVSGHGPLQSNGSLISGRVGDEVNQQAGYDAARQTGLAILATLARRARGRQARPPPPVFLLNIFTLSDSNK